jgi:hypothetical protein
MISPLKNTDFVKELEFITTPLVNLTNKLDKKYRQNFQDLHLSIIMWYHKAEGIDANTSIYKKWDKVSELLGFRPIYHVNHSHRNALWAFEWKADYSSENYVLIYYDVTGMKIQIHQKFKKSEIIPMLKQINNLLNGH